MYDQGSNARLRTIPSTLLCILFFIVAALPTWGQATYTSKATGGNWNAAGTWTIGGTADGDGDGIPDANDNVIIIGNTIATPVNVNVASAALTVTFQANTVSSYLTANANLTVTNAITFSDPTTAAMSQNLNVGGVTVSCGSLVMVGTTGTSVRSNVVTVATGGTLTVNGALTTPSTDANENSITLSGTGQLNVVGPASATGAGTFSLASTSTVRWFGDNTNFRSDLGYGNLIVEVPSGAAANRTRTSTTALSVAGALTVQSLDGTRTSTLDAAGFNISVTGATSINARGSLVDSNNAGTNTFTGAVSITANGTLSTASNSAYNFAGGITNDGSLSLTGTGTISLTNTSSKSIAGAGTTYTFNNLTLVSGNITTVDATAAVTITNALTFVTNSANSSFTLNGAITLTVGSITEVDPTGSFTQTVTVNSGGTISVTGNITLADTGGSTETNNVIVNTGGTLTVNGNIVTNGSAANENFVTLNGTGALNIAGTFNTGNGGTFTASSTSTVRWFGDNTNFRNITYGNLIIEIPSTATANRTRTSTATLAVQGSLTVQSLHASFISTFDAAGFDLTVTGSTNLNARGTLADSNNAGTNTFTGAVNIATNGTLSSGNTSFFLFANDIANDGTISFTANAPVSFTGTASRTISGAGTFTFYNFTLSASANVNVTATTDITINSNLSWGSDCLLVLGTSSNVVMGSTATITGYTSARYVQLDGSTSSGSQLIQTTNGATTGSGSWRQFYPVGTTTGGYTPLDLSAVTLGGTAPVSGALLKIKPIYGASVVGQMRRQFRLNITGNVNATTMTGEKFYFNSSTDVSAGDVVGNYTYRWFLSFANGTWFNNLTPTATAATNTSGTTYTYTVTTAESMASGTYYYALGNSTAFTNVWYSYQNGNWSDSNIWTLDPSGTSLNNPLNQIPLSGDQVVILSNISVTGNVSSLLLSSLTLQSNATLDLGTTTGHNLGTITGTGLLRIAGTGGVVNLPSGTYTSFVASTGGTIEYYASTAGSYTISATNTTYNNLLLSNGTGNNIVFVTAPTGSVTYSSTSYNLLVNGTLNITASSTGTVSLQINDNTATSRSIAVVGDVTVSSNGKIYAGTGAPAGQSSLKLFGNFTNNGVVQFFDPTDAVLTLTNYNAGTLFKGTALRGNTINVTASGIPDKTFTLNGQTDFYRLIVNKGSGQQSLLTVNSSATTNFRLFGPNDIDVSGSAPNFISNNALSIQNGTLQLTGTMTIPSLVEENSSNADGYPIPQNGALWVNGAGVSIVASSQAGSSWTASNDRSRRILLSGLLRVSSGTLATGLGTGGGATNSTTGLGWTAGISAEDDGVLIIEGTGTLTTAQIRTRVTGTNNFAVTISGSATVNVGTINGIDNSSYARFDLQYTTCSFTMTGGTFTVANPTSNSVSGFRVASAVGNYSVTGGTVNFNLTGTLNTDFDISTTTPLNILNINRTSGATAVNAVLVTSLTTLGNLTLVAANTPKLYCASNSVTVGGDFDIQTGCSYNTGTTATPSGANTLTFNGSGAQAWKHTTSTDISNLTTVVVNKSAGTLTLGGSGLITIPNITAALTLTSGTFDDGANTVTVTGSLTNNATHTSSTIGAAVGSITFTTAAAATINGSGGKFGNLTIGTNATVSLGGTQTVNGDLRLTAVNSTLSIGSYQLVVMGGIYTDASTGIAFSNSKRIVTAGFRNDGGLTRKATDAVDLLFPVGTTTSLLCWITINTDVNNSTGTAGTITVRPVQSVHPNVVVTNQSAAFYWRVTSSGFANITSVTHSAYKYTGAALNGASGSNYRAARFDPNTFTWIYSNGTYNATSGAGASQIALGSSPYPFNTNSAWIVASTGAAYAGGTNLDGEYTAGTSTAFGSGTTPVTVYYSRVTTGNWSTTSTWSNASVGGTAGSTIPCSTCPVVIGNSSNVHTISMDANNLTCGSLYIDASSTLDCKSYTGLNFGETTSGSGTIKISSTAATGALPTGDFLNFFGSSGGTLEWYVDGTTPTSYTIPTNVSNSYYNLTVNSSGGRTITFPGSNLTIYNTLTKSGSATAITDPNRTYTLNGSFNVTAGTFNFATGSGTTTVTQTGNLSVSSGATLGVSAASGTHTYTTSGSITNDGTLNFSTVMNTVFTGTANTSITGSTVGAATTFNKITVNKGTSQTPVLTVDVKGTLTTPSNNWLTISNGTFNFAKTGGSIVVTNAATTPYTIGTTAKLMATAGTITVSSINANDSDLLLNGALEVAGGTINVGISTNSNDNDIEYASTGTPTITVSSGTLYVNGSIRRPTTTLSGALTYNQTGGDVTVGGRNSSNQRGVFEIDNSGSSFTLTGTGTLTVKRPVAGTFSDLYLNPATSSVASTSIIYLGIAGSTQTITLNSDPKLGSLLVYDNTTASMVNSTLTTLGTLTINTAGTLNTNSLDVTIGGDLTINGTGVYNGTIGSGNTTTFNGSGAQAGTLTSGSTFLNMTVNKSAGTVSLSGTSPTITNLNILSGTLDVGTLDITVTGYIVNNSTETGTTGYILLGGTATAQTITSSNGTFANLKLTGSAGAKTVTVTGNMSITGTLNFATTSRYLSIGSYKLTFGANGAVSGNAGTAFILTNGVSSDLGVVKTWGTGTNAFTYAVGTRINYTPLTLTLTVSAGGDMTVIPVDDRHPTANTGSSDPVLNYYWIISRGSGIAYSATGSHVYAFPSSLMGGNTGTVSAAFLDVGSSSPGWTVNSTGSAATTTSMSYTDNLNTNLPSSTSTEFHYSVGTTNSLPNPITPVYSRLADASVASAGGGSWNDTNSWTLQSDGMGAAWGAVPYGNYIVVLSGATINADNNGRKTFITQIDGTLNLTTGYVGHSFGILKGTGTLKTTSATLPAGNYTTFVSSAGGTIEYNGNISMNGSRTVYNNVATSGGTITIPAGIDLTLNGSINIKSGSVFSNANDRNISLGGSWTNSGSFTQGTGTVTFTGATAATVTGSTTFNNVTINKTANVTLSGTGPTTVNNTLTLTSGNIVSVTGNKLTLPTAATISGGSSSSFIAGPMDKVMASGSTFTYPVGSVTSGNYRPAILANTTGADTWTMEYVGNSPSNQGYNHRNHTLPINKVSMFEYWNISRVGSTAADVTLTYNTGSYLGSNIGTVANLRVVHWNTATSSWEVAPGGGTVSQSGTNITGTVTTTNQTSFSPDTFGSLDVDSPLPVTWLTFTAQREGAAVTLRWTTASEWNNDHFEVERSVDGKTFKSIGTHAAAGTSSSIKSYNFVDAEALTTSTYYYRIKQVDHDGKFDYSHVAVVMATDKVSQRWSTVPNPTFDNSHFNIKILDEMASQSVPTHVKVISSTGIVLLDIDGSLEAVNKKLEGFVQALSAGVYLVEISDGTNKEVYRVARM